MKEPLLRFKLTALFRSLHLDADAVDGFARCVQDAAKRLRCHFRNQAPFPVPFCERVHHVSIRREQFSSIGRNVVDRSLYLIEDENGWPPVVVQRFFLAGLQRHLKDREWFGLEDDFMVGKRARQSRHPVPESQVEGSGKRHDHAA